MSGPEERPAPAPGEGGHLPARIPPELTAEIRNAIVEARLAAERGTGSAALRDLADALRAVQEGQERIARNLDRADRSEAVIQSTQALNETFRGVRQSQEALADRLRREERRPWKAAAAAALLVLLAGGGAVAFFLLREDDLRGRIEEIRAGLGSRDRDASERRIAEVEKDLLDRLEAVSKKSSMTEAEKAIAERELLSLRGDLERLRRENETLDAGREEALRLARENASLRDEVARLRGEADAARARAEVAEKATAARVEAAKAGPAKGEPAKPEPANGGPAKPEAGPGREEKPPPLPATAVTDQGQVRKLLVQVNGLFSAAGGGEIYRVTAAEAVDGERLVRAVVEVRRADGSLFKTFEAGECRMVLQPASRSLEIRLKDGSVTYLGTRKVAFLDGRYTARLAIDPAPFRSAGSPIIAME